MKQYLVVTIQFDLCEIRKWPVYKTGEAGGKRAEEIHQIMDDEVGQAKAAMKPRSVERPMLMKERLK